MSVLLPRVRYPVRAERRCSPRPDLVGVPGPCHGEDRACGGNPQEPLLEHDPRHDRQDAHPEAPQQGELHTLFLAVGTVAGARGDGGRRCGGDGWRRTDHCVDGVIPPAASGRSGGWCAWVAGSARGVGLLAPWGALIERDERLTLGVGHDWFSLSVGGCGTPRATRVSVNGFSALRTGAQARAAVARHSSGGRPLGSPPDQDRANQRASGPSGGPRDRTKAADTAPRVAPAAAWRATLDDENAADDRADP